MTDKEKGERLKRVILWLIGQGLTISQEDAAKMLKKSPAYISHLVTGAKPISLKFASDFSRVFENINSEYLLGESDQMLGCEISGSNDESKDCSKKEVEFSDLIKALNHISEAVLKNADSDKIRAEAELKRAETENRNSRNVEELINLLKVEKQKTEDKTLVKKGTISSGS